MNPKDFKITNGIIKNFSIRLDRGFCLSAWLFIEHEDGGTQGFGGFALGGVPDAACGDHANQPNLCAEWLVAVLRACELDDEADIRQVVGKAVRVVRAHDGGWNADILGIGHIVKNDRWFHAKERMDSLLAARKQVRG